MATTQLPYLTSTTKLETNDLLLTRKSGTNADNKITFNDFVSSVGNPGMNGYKVISHAILNDKLTINLLPANGGFLPQTNEGELTFSEGGHVAFTIPVNHKGLIDIKILDTTYNLVSSHGDSTFSCVEGEYFVLQYTPTQNNNFLFRRINDIEDAAYVDFYSVTSTTVDNNITTISLATTFGALKTKYFEGMVINFVPTMLSKSPIKIKVDGLIEKDFNFELNNIETSVYPNQSVRAVFDGAKFIIRARDYTSLWPNFRFVGSYTDNYLFNFRNLYYTNINSYVYEFTLDTNLNTNYTTLEEAILDIESKFGANKNNVKVKLKIGTVQISQSICIDRDLSYIELNPLSNEIDIDCNAFTAAFFIIGDGQFFSVARGVTINVSSSVSTSTLTGFNFIHVHNNTHNIFEDFSIIMKTFATNRTVYSVFCFVIAATGVSIKNITINSLNKNYYHGINAGVYCSHIYLNNVVIKNRKQGGHALLIGGVTWKNNTTTYTPYRHDIFLINSDLSSDSTTDISDIYFLNPQTYKGYATLNQIDCKAGCNVTANTNSPRWGIYTREGDGNTQGTL
jgi:hypothetical protein